MGVKLLAFVISLKRVNAVWPWLTGVKLLAFSIDAVFKTLRIRAIDSN